MFKIVFFFISINLLFGCTSSKPFLQAEIGNSKHIIVRKGIFDGTSYLLIKGEGIEERKYQIWIEFGSKYPFSARKQIFDSEKIYSTWHMVTDTTAGLSSFNRYMNRSYYVNNGRDMVPISEEEKKIFTLVSSEIDRRGYGYNFNKEDISKILGWIEVTKD